MNNLKTLVLMVMMAAIMMFIGGLIGGRGGLMFMLLVSPVSYTHLTLPTKA